MDRTEILNLLIDKYKLQSYLEIGVDDGKNFAAINCVKKVGVDPNGRGTYKMTSDEYFHNFGYPYPAVNFDLIFIDGLHTEEQAYEDARNALRFLSPYGFIVMHDCNPQTKWATRPIEQYKKGNPWNGTAYRAFIRLKSELRGYSCFVINDAQGCGVITKHELLRNDVYDYDFEWFSLHRNELLQLITVDKFKELLS